MSEENKEAAVEEVHDPMEDFFIQDAQNEGIRVPLYLPNGNDSGHHLVLYGHFSEVFQRVRREVLSNSPAELRKLKNDKEAQNKLIEERKLEMTACLIKEWSFPNPCSKRQKMIFLRKAPQVAEMIDRVAGEQSLFMKGSSVGSSDGSDGTSNSQSLQPVPTPQPEAI